VTQQEIVNPGQFVQFGAMLTIGKTMILIRTALNAGEKHRQRHHKFSESVALHGMLVQHLMVA
jgi:hypothetical protein